MTGNKMRSTSTLLKIVRKRRNELNIPALGLCGIINNCVSQVITDKEGIRLHKILQSNKPKKVLGLWWFDNDGIERGKFLNKLIKKYSEKK